MPTILTHAVVGAAIAQVSPATSTRHATIGAALCAALPDVDVLAFHFGVPYASMFGHRGLTHSLFFAILVGTVAEFSRRSRADRDVLPWLWLQHPTLGLGRLPRIALTGFSDPARRARRVIARATGLVFLLATASHGLLDALTDGGLGVAFFAPFSDARYFFPWRPIAVSPIGARFFSARGAAVLISEFVWLWLPTAFAIGLIAWSKSRRTG